MPTTYTNLVPNGTGHVAAGTVTVRGIMRPAVSRFRPGPDAVGYQTTDYPLFGGHVLTLEWFNGQTTLPATFADAGLSLIGPE